MTSFCIIRKYKDSDQQAIKDIITEATMEQVTNFFWGAMLSELLPQVAVVFIAVCYILIGIPLKYCLFGVPIVIIMIYTCIWLGHFIKANELSNDLHNIPSNYMKDIMTTFYVAEVYGKAGEAELAALINKQKKIEYDFYTEIEFQTRSVNVHGLSKIIVGTVGVTRSMNHSKRAWLRRMAVKMEFRRRGVASHLLREAIKFCEGRRFDGIELVTTECHSEAKQLYVNEGFSETDVSHKNYLGIGASQVSYRMYRPIVRPHDVDNKEESLLETQETSSI